LRSSPTGPPTGSDSSSDSGLNGGGAASNGRAAAANGQANSPNGKRKAKRTSKRASRVGRRLFAFDRGFEVRFVAGADEAGRGCLAGPLVAAGVLFDLERIGPREVRALSGLNDSKQQTPEERAELFPVILRVAAKVAIVSRCAPGIDTRGLHVTNLAALRDALARVACDGCLCLSDGFPVARLGFDQQAVIGGDAKSAAIAAASVIAKETRDRYMRRADSAHPGWEFAQHVGYSTPEHRDAIERLGVSPLHRLSFQSAAYQQLAFDGSEAALEMLEADELPGPVERYPDHVETQ
jgi:ribonuclease HII